MSNSKVRKTAGCQCKNCQDRCRAAPGWFKPREIEKVAKYLKMKMVDFFRKYVSVDYWVADEKFEKNVFVLSPAIVNENPGDVFPFSNRYGQCIFYKNGKCKIHAVKPYECAMIFHDTMEKEGNAIHREVTSKWNTKGNQEQIKKLLGKTPEIPDEWNIPQESDGGMLPWLP